jgi:hypothetical protein
MFKGEEGSFLFSQCGDNPFPSTAFFRMSWEGFEPPTHNPIQKMLSSDFLKEDSKI